MILGQGARVVRGLSTALQPEPEERKARPPTPDSL
jgi:hypothetical protein